MAAQVACAEHRLSCIFQVMELQGSLDDDFNGLDWLDDVFRD